MTALATHRCLHHPTREAVARCPECTQFYCRECITEHDDRVICADCLRRLVHVPERRGPRWPWLRAVTLTLLGGMLAWFFFYEVGQALLAVPTSFHDGTLWNLEGS